jgi:hypothetical protein
MPRRAVLEDVQPSHWLMILKISANALSARGRDPGGGSRIVASGQRGGRADPATGGVPRRVRQRPR